MYQLRYSLVHILLSKGRLFCWYTHWVSWNICDRIATVSVKPTHVWLMLMQRLICICACIQMEMKWNAQMQDYSPVFCICRLGSNACTSLSNILGNLYLIDLLCNSIVISFFFFFCYVQRNKNGTLCWEEHYIFYWQIFSPVALSVYTSK